MNYRLQLFMNSVCAIAIDADAVRVALGIESLDNMPEEFWQTQLYAARNRYFRLLLAIDGNLPLTSEYSDLDDFDLGRLQKLSENYHKKGHTYADVRAWWKDRGQFECDKAFRLRRESKELQNTFLSVLFIFEKGAQWLMYNGLFGAELTTREMAHRFPVESISQTEKAYLSEMAKHFESVKEMFGAKEVKVLVVKGEQNEA